MKIVKVVLVGMLLAVSVGAQDKAKESVPKLATDQKLVLVQAQNEIFKLQLQQKNLEDFYRQVQQQLTTANTDFQTKVATALDKSGIDKNKWEINFGTLEVTPKPLVQAEKK